ncbi:MAG: DNA polymerase IV [Candidatus Aureabacteria bacterium]|nr:DNA polymerase IV [Candidatus Auribacterota bacterium]
MSRIIFHLDMDAFFVSVELLRRPWLKGKPVVVGGEPTRRGVVASASYEARRHGIRSAMPLAQAKRLCPRCVFLPCHFDDYADVSTKLFGLLEHFTPDVEPISLEEAFLDMSGFRWLYGPPLVTADRIHAEIRGNLSLPSSIGIASNKLVARIASAHAKPNGVLYVLPGNERDFLAPLPVRSIPGVGPRTAEQLGLMGVNTIGDLRAIGERLLWCTFGTSGSWLSRAASGEDDEPVTSRAGQKSVSREITFPEDLLDRERILAELSFLVEAACQALRRAGKQARIVSLKLRYADFSTVTRSFTLDEPTDLDREVFAVATRLFRKTWTRRLRIRLIGVSLSNFVGSGWQPSLLPGGGDRGRFKRLYAGVDRIKEKYGDGAITTGTRLIVRGKPINTE